MPSVGLIAVEDDFADADCDGNRLASLREGEAPASLCADLLPLGGVAGRVALACDGCFSLPLPLGEGDAVALALSGSDARRCEVVVALCTVEVDGA